MAEQLTFDWEPRRIRKPWISRFDGFYLLGEEHQCWDWKPCRQYAGPESQDPKQWADLSRENLSLMRARDAAAAALDWTHDAPSGLRLTSSWVRGSYPFAPV